MHRQVLLGHSFQYRNVNVVINVGRVSFKSCRVLKVGTKALWIGDINLNMFLHCYIWDMPYKRIYKHYYCENNWVALYFVYQLSFLKEDFIQERKDMVTKDAPSTVLSKNSWSREGTSLKEMWASFSLACHLPTFTYVRMLLVGLGRGRTYNVLQEESNLLWKYFGVCWLQGTGGISIYGSSFEDENFTCECLGSAQMICGIHFLGNVVFLV